MARIIKTDNTSEQIDNLFLDNIEKIIGGFPGILRVQDDKKLILIINDGQKALDLAENKTASAIYGSVLFGNAILVSIVELNGFAAHHGFQFQIPTIAYQGGKPLTERNA